ncbi:MAG TPA: zinc-binding alcohol dehydrogenase family protein [Vicinamibacterales bacterium]|jgi:NADPH2:quinone reductase|nr:zinc-binding alcohol dehydrogenase family protein [Vicinamibacterales bacterium]
MKAAVLHTFGQPPRFDDFPDPQAGPDEVIVHVRAASLKNVDKGRALGTHYDRHAELPVVCGLDGVGVLDDGTRVYCGGPRPPYGTMAERTVVSRAWTVAVPDAIDDIRAAALPNPALSSWLPLVWRAKLERGETVLILGATGVAGKLAIQIAKHLGAGRVVAAGRNPRMLETLSDLGADAIVALDQSDDDLAAAFVREGPFDVVLDYLWGRPTTVLLDALTGHDLKAESSRTRLIEIGSMAGPTIALSAATLRSSGIEIYGSGGGGSIPRTAIFETFPSLWALAAAGTLRIDTEAVPLADVERAWQRQDVAGRRLVFVP